jgi:antitoxin (DNA-binding transcriptional repressor) of toxin-antitoxin stability system
MLINLETTKEKGKADAGSYEFKTNKTSGLTFAEGEPIARLIPKTQEKQVRDEDPARRTEKLARLKPLPAGYRRQQITAANMVRANPFLNANQSKIRLRTLY